MRRTAYGHARREVRSGENARTAWETPQLVERPDRESAEVASSPSDRVYRADARLHVERGALALPAPVERRYRGRGAPAEPLDGLLKRTVDVVGALVLGLLFAPLMLVVAALLARTGSVVYRHRRVGAGGELFECLKFRTMVPDADRILHDLLASDETLKAEWLRWHKLRNDPRVTLIGGFLRRTSLDELPQLWNVLRGEMSLVGPRPVIREELLRYGRNSAAYLSVKPGITGLWQTMGRNDTDYRRRVAMDVYYVRHRTFFLDLYILARTVFVVLAGNGAY